MTYTKKLRDEWREEIKRYPQMDSLGSADWWIEKIAQNELEMMKKVVGKIDKLVNPYPKEVFPELPAGFMVNLVLFCKENDTSIDRLSADYARWQRELTKDDLKSVIASLQEELTDNK